MLKFKGKSKDIQYHKFHYLLNIPILTYSNERRRFKYNNTIESVFIDHN